jgi:hypothetical protein
MLWLAQVHLVSVAEVICFTIALQGVKHSGVNPIVLLLVDSYFCLFQGRVFNSQLLLLEGALPQR